MTTLLPTLSHKAGLLIQSRSNGANDYDADEFLRTPPPHCWDVYDIWAQILQYLEGYSLVRAALVNPVAKAASNDELIPISFGTMNNASLFDRLTLHSTVALTSMQGWCDGIRPSSTILRLPSHTLCVLAEQSSAEHIVVFPCASDTANKGQKSKDPASEPNSVFKMSVADTASCQEDDNLSSFDLTSGLCRPFLKKPTVRSIDGNRWLTVEDEEWFPIKVAATGGVSSPCGSHMMLSLGSESYVLEIRTNRILCTFPMVFLTTKWLPPSATGVQRIITNENCGVMSLWHVRTHHVERQWQRTSTPKDHVIVPHMTMRDSKMCWVITADPKSVSTGSGDRSLWTFVSLRDGSTIQEFSFAKSTIGKRLWAGFTGPDTPLFIGRSKFLLYDVSTSSFADHAVNLGSSFLLREVRYSVACRAIVGVGYDAATQMTRLCSYHVSCGSSAIVPRDFAPCYRGTSSHHLTLLSFGVAVGTNDARGIFVASIDLETLQFSRDPKRGLLAKCSWFPHAGPGELIQIVSTPSSKILNLLYDVPRSSKSYVVRWDLFFSGGKQMETTRPPSLKKR